MGLTVVGSGIGTVFLPPILKLLIAEYNWKNTFLLLGAFILNCIACGIVLLPLKPTKVWVKQRRSSDAEGVTIESQSQLVDALVRDSVERDKNDKENFFSAVSVQVEAPEDDANKNNDVTSPLIVNVMNPMDDIKLMPSEVMYRRGSSHSPSRMEETLARRHSTGVNAPVSPVTIGTTSPKLRHRGRPTLSAHHSQMLRDDSRVNPDLIHRPDLRYPASLTHIPLYLSNRDLYVHQVSQYASQTGIDVGEETPTESDLEAQKSLLVRFLITLRNSFDFTLFRDIPFALFCLSSFITSLGYNAPYLYIVSWGTKELGFEAESGFTYNAAWLPSIIGVGNIVGRLFWGFIADIPKVSRMLLYIIALTLCGIATALSTLSGSWYWMIGYSFVFGVLIGAYISLTPLLVVDLLGLHRLDVAFGVLGVVQCAATLAGPPLLAVLRDWSGSFNLLFWTCGACIAISGVMLIPVYLFYEKLRSDVTKEDLELGRAATLGGAHDSDSSDRVSSEDIVESKKTTVA